ncbi:MAG: cell division protein FtsZ [Bacteroidaceae bacterium]|jgi:cell division protein FtsZ|nr:cell division protein FtsZ [Bacteroidaceae bacterium]MCI6802490.1 cell division protein FtsZ [Prevotellaceae bacterium]MDD6016467.1 cell division protein FtsZ [Prevotellaceae bacterium]MDD7526876.1 cell division protein FtsZ [Prevotellaceae bacterium]MDY5761170.1 cell division protein FtsZ [Bacteroidaceae bacterium]
MAENEDIGVFNFAKGATSIIKVIGVGGGGSNAVNHMYNEGIHDVTFVVCNTDNKALQDSPVPEKIQLGSEGLGAGNRPDKARKATEESIEAIKSMLSDGTKMAFITAGMGGGTGTGAAPLIAKTAKDMGILTVGIVTIPFRWEGNKKIDQALDGVEEMNKNVDALLVINNERLREIYQDFTVIKAFAKADDTLCNAARSIAEIITMHGIINLDFNDVSTVLKDGGVAIMSTGYGSGENRVTKGINDALNSPLLNNNDIYRATKILLRLSVPDEAGEGNSALMMDEMNEVHEFMAKVKREDVETKWGLSVDPSLTDQVKITILATGFGVEDIDSDELNNRLLARDKEQQQRDAEKAEQEAERAHRRETIYGPDKNHSTIRRPLYSYIFKEEDLDNEDVISMVETSPTYKRSKETLRQLTDMGTNKSNVIEPGATIMF